MTVDEVAAKTAQHYTGGDRVEISREGFDYLVRMALIGEAEVARMAAPAAPKDLYLPEYRTSPIR